MKHNNNVRLLAVLADPESDEKSEYRFLVDGAHVRYVTLDGGLIDPEHRTYEPKLLPQLPVFPPGDWNEGRVGKDGHTGKPFFCETRRSTPPIERVRQTLYRVSHPSSKTPVLAKFAQFPWEIPYFAAETTSYEWIHGQGIGPEFLGHIHENGRVIGFLLEEIHNARTAEPEDLAACQRSLQKLHDLGIVHGDINKHNFLIRQDGDAVLIDFETAYKCTDPDILDEEYRHVKESLEDTSGRGGAGMASDSSSD
uniref:Protein kinase domain-containing protein n=1 Tax=Fusarium oxysporum (strain Fo5176) TaxID=660025 RepID=A0A0D2Y229_FUSOF